MKRNLILGSIGWLALTVALVVSLFALRERTLTPAAVAASQQAWESWREDARKMNSTDAPVKRRVSPSADPPALVLMRDYFGTCLSAGLFFGSALYWVVFALGNGVMKRQAFPIQLGPDTPQR